MDPSPDAAAAGVDPASSTSPPSPLYARLADYSSERGGLALVVVEGSRVIFATGQNGQPLEKAHPIFNASESFWCPVAIAAEVDGLLELDEPVSLTLESFEDDRLKRRMRIRELLQYTSGLESGIWPLSRERPANHYERALELGMVASPGERFQFGPSHLAVFGALLRRKLEPLGLDSLAFLELRVLEPIGLQLASWNRDAAGNPELSAGAELSAGEWAKYGIFVRDRGSWQGRPILDAAAMETCFVGSDAEPRFGMGFWLNPAEASAAPVTRERGGLGSFYPQGLEDLVVAAGTGNQRLYVIRSLDLVVARLGSPDRRWRDREFLDLLLAAQALPRGDAAVAP